jgi:hypothetical protein
VRDRFNPPEWEDVVAVSTPCKLLIHINIAMCLG